MSNQKYLPEGFGFSENSEITSEERFSELISYIKTDTIVSGVVKYINNDATSATIDLGYGLKGWLSSYKMSDSRKVSSIRSSLGKVINFSLVGYNEEKGTFTCNRIVALHMAKEWNKKNYSTGDIIIAKVTSIIDTGVFLDIGGGHITFLCPKQISPSSYINDLGKIFHVGQYINVMIMEYNPNFETFEVNYFNCPQFGLEIGTSLSVILYMADHKGRWLCYFQNTDNPYYQYGVISNHIPNMVCEQGDILPAKVISFCQGIPILKI